MLEKNTDLRMGRLDPSSLKKHVKLWNVAPRWPGSAKAPCEPMELAELVREMYVASGPDTHLVLWMPAERLHNTLFEPADMAGNWRCDGTVISGSDPIHIGYAYSHTRSKVDWGSKLILDERKKRGPSSTKAVKFILDKLTQPGDLVADAFAHASAVLPIWSRRSGLRYIGYTTSKAKHKTICKALAQIELPGIQMELPSK